MKTPEQIQAAFDLARQYESIADSIFAYAKDHLAEDRDHFDQLYRQALSIDQKAHDLYAGIASAETAATAADIQQIGAATKLLEAAAKTIADVDGAVSVGLGVVAVIGTVTAAVLDPTHVSAAVAVGAIGELVGSLAR